MDWDIEPTLKQFVKTFDAYVEDIGVKHSDEGYMGSHCIIASIHVEDIGSDDVYEIVGLDLDQLGGCGCPAGIVIQIKKVTQ